MITKEMFKESIRKINEVNYMISIKKTSDKDFNEPILTKEDL